VYTWASVSGCKLSINGLDVVTARSGALEVEYALFDPGDLKLVTTAIGQVRELGYETTVEGALENLEQIGASVGLAERVAMILRGSVGEHYAKGPIVFRHVGRLLTHQVLQSSSYDPESRSYLGTFLDLEQIARDSGIANLSSALHVLFLAALLVELEPGATVRLNTESLSQAKPTAYRSYQRVRFTDLRGIPDRLMLMQKTAAQPRPIEREQGLSRSELARTMQAEAMFLASEDAKMRLKALEGEILTRAPRATGPLADPDLWLIEAAMDEGRTDGVLEQLDMIETDNGRTPATSYLRARAALLRGDEAASVIAERVTSLALSMTSFIELEVLAAEAWLRASEWKRAHPFAQDVLRNPAADEILRARAARVVQLAQAGSTGREMSDSVFAKPAVTTFPETTGSVRPHSVRAPAPAPMPFLEYPSARQSVTEPPPTVRGSPSVAPPNSPRMPHNPPPEPFLPSSRPVASGGPAERVTAKPLAVTATRASAPPVSLDPPPRPSSVPPPSYGASPSSLMKTASLPPFAVSQTSGAPTTPRVSERAQSTSTELAEHLEYPGLADVDILRIPQSAEEARRAFTQLTRDLAVDYRETLGITLRMDLVSLEAIQNYLAETLPSGVVRTAGEAREIRRHGAFISEMLARRLNAQWTDLNGEELGHWKMVISPGTIVYPFGRVVRFVRMQRRERDLVSYFLELENGLLRSLIP
jgi:hypothetical protein